VDYTRGCILSIEFAQQTLGRGVRLLIFGESSSDTLPQRVYLAAVWVDHGLILIRSMSYPAFGVT